MTVEISHRESTYSYDVPILQLLRQKARSLRSSFWPVPMDCPRNGARIHAQVPDMLCRLRRLGDRRGAIGDGRDDPENVVVADLRGIIGACRNELPSGLVSSYSPQCCELVQIGVTDFGRVRHICTAIVGDEIEPLSAVGIAGRKPLCGFCLTRPCRPAPAPAASSRPGYSRGQAL